MQVFSLRPITFGHASTALQGRAPLFSAAADTFVSQHVAAQQVLFSADVPHSKPYHHTVLYSDFNDGASNEEALKRIKDTMQFVMTHGDKLASAGFPMAPWAKQLPSGLLNDLRTFSDTPFGNIDYSSLTIQRLAMSRPNHDVLVHVTDPGVGNGDSHDRSILVTEKHGVLIGPNNGSLGLMLSNLDKAGESYSLIPVDLAKVEAFERLRFDNPHYILPESFHARDLFAVIAGAINAGVSPEAFKDEKRKDYIGLRTPFVEAIKPLQLGVGDSLEFLAFRDKTFGNIKTSLTLSQNTYADQLKDLIKAGARFKVVNPATGSSLEMPVVTSFAKVATDQPLLYLGSTYAVPPGKTKNDGQRFVELALNLGDISTRLGISEFHTVPLTIKRVK